MTKYKEWNNFKMMPGFIFSWNTGIKPEFRLLCTLVFLHWDYNLTDCSSNKIKTEVLFPSGCYSCRWLLMIICLYLPVLQVRFVWKPYYISASVLNGTLINVFYWWLARPVKRISGDCFRLAMKPNFYGFPAQRKTSHTHTHTNRQRFTLVEKSPEAFVLLLLKS